MGTSFVTLRTSRTIVEIVFLRFFVDHAGGRKGGACGRALAGAGIWRLAQRAFRVKSGSAQCMDLLRQINNLHSPTTFLASTQRGLDNVFHYN
jgi:hypothetical protein